MKCLGPSIIMHACVGADVRAYAGSDSRAQSDPNWWLANACNYPSKILYLYYANVSYTSYSI